MSGIKVIVGESLLVAKLEYDKAPKTCDAFKRALPLKTKLVHARWSGFSVWIPLGDCELNVEYEAPTSYPAPGQVLLYPGGVSEVEILIPYGPTRFACKAGQLAGNHFLTIMNGGSELAAIGECVLWEGAMPITFEED
tara:strand:- start:6 stop:419 length:414 start_codon:yes stop_codon:yes gene_type:complete